MSDMLSIGASGVRAYQSALTTVSENIANVGSAGYARRSVALREVTAPGKNSGGNAAIGVAVVGVDRAGDTLRAADARRAGSDLARTTTGVAWLDQVESALSSNQLSARMTAFFGTATALAAAPAGSAQRIAMVEAGTGVANAFASTASAIDQTISDVDLTAEQSVSTLSSLAKVLAEVNLGFGRVTPGSDAAATLADRRDSILESMSAIVDVSPSVDTLGRATVRVGGANGPLLVQADDAGTVTYVRDAHGTTSFATHFSGETHGFTANGGALAGIADTAPRLVEARRALDGIATAFVTGVNAVQAQGDDLNGAAGAPFFAQNATDPSKVTLALTDPRKVAAAGRGLGVRDNANLAALASTRTTADYEGRVNNLVTENAAALAARKTVASAQSAIRDGAVAARDAVTTVNLDTEAVDLLRFQQAYQASSRVIQVARETLQSILDIR